MERAGRAAKTSLVRQSIAHAHTRTAGLVIIGDDTVLMLKTGWHTQREDGRIKSNGSSWLEPAGSWDIRPTAHTSAQSPCIRYRAASILALAAWSLSCCVAHDTFSFLPAGDEILSAKVEDVNTQFLCAELRAIGWRVKKVRKQLCQPCCSSKETGDMPSVCGAAARRPASSAGWGAPSLWLPTVLFSRPSDAPIQ